MTTTPYQHFAERLIIRENLSAIQSQLLPGETQLALKLAELVSLMKHNDNKR